MNYLWLVFLAIYILSPIDAHPMFLDDLIAAGVMIYLYMKNAKKKRQADQYRTYSGQSQSGQSGQSTGSRPRGPLTLGKAYTTLGVSPDSSLEDVSKAYRSKMSKSHPDKVSHLSEELQERARELTLTLNEAYELIRAHKKS